MISLLRAGVGVPTELSQAETQSGGDSGQGGERGLLRFRGCTLTVSTSLAWQFPLRCTSLLLLLKQMTTLRGAKQCNFITYVVLKVGNSSRHGSHWS